MRIFKNLEKLMKKQVATLNQNKILKKVTSIELKITNLQYIGIK